MDFEYRRNSLGSIAGTATGDQTLTLNLGHENVGWGALGPAIVCTSLATIVVALRWYTRKVLLRCTGLDDYLISISLLLSWAMCAVVGAATIHGFDTDSELGTPTMGKYILSNNSLWSLTVALTKVSILAQYMRIFSGQRTRFLCLLLMFLILPATCWGFFGGIFLCSPVAKLWNPSLPGHCIDAQTYWVSVASIDIGLDFFILLLPVPAISGLRIPRKQKIATLLVFLLGFFVCIVSVIRLAMVITTAEAGDPVLSILWSIVWSNVEANIGIICASLLALKGLLVKIFPKLFEETEPPAHSMMLPHFPMADSTQPILSDRPSTGLGFPSPRLGSFPKRPQTAGSWNHSSVTGGSSDPESAPAAAALSLA